VFGFVVSGAGLAFQKKKKTKMVYIILLRAEILKYINKL
jgi:hypothetical protein